MNPRKVALLLSLFLSTMVACDSGTGNPGGSKGDLAARSRSILGEIIEPATEAFKAYRNHSKLPSDSLIGTDQGDNEDDINALLNEVISKLEYSNAETIRQKIRSSEGEIEELRQGQVRCREELLNAPSKDQLGALESTYTKSREDLQDELADADRRVKNLKAAVIELRADFVTEMRRTGLDLDYKSAECLLSTITGDDYVQMCVVIDNVRGVTVQLQELSSESGESLDAAKRYYGVYVILLKLMDRVQTDFIDRIRNEMVPKLADLRGQAEGLLMEIEMVLAQGGDATIAKQNTSSNELTIRACELYSEYILGQADNIEIQRERLRVSLRDAEITYDTLLLSSEVTKIIKEGSQNLAALMQLEVPPLAGFENAELRAEFERLTKKMVRP